jgi:flagellar motility protein MotE (MotC chaperone)
VSGVDWLPLLIGIGGLAIAAISTISRSFDKSLSIREHDEFRKNVDAAIAETRRAYQRDMDELRESSKREVNNLLDRIKVIEQTRPTTGELQALFRSKEQKGERNHKIRR